MKIPFLSRVLLTVFVAVFFWGCSAESKRARALERAAEYYKAGELENARIEYQNVLQTDPENLTANERLGTIWFERGSPIRAAHYLAKVKTLAPERLEPRLKLARIMLSFGNAGEARNETMGVLARSADLSDAIVLLTETIRSKEDYKAAEQLLEKIPEKNTAPYQVASANLMSLRGDMGGAKAALQKAISLDAKFPDAHLALAAIQLAQKSPSDALASFKTAAELSPIRSTARLKYAAYLSQSGALPEALAYLNDITRQAPDYLPALRALVQIALSEKKYDEAEAHINTLFAREPADYEGRVLRARLWISQGDVARAITDLEKVGQDFPGVGFEKFQLALCYLQQKEQTKALKALQEAVGSNPDHLEAQLLLAQLNLKSGAAEPAALAMAKLVTARPNLMQAYPIMIEAMRALDRLDQAASIVGQNIKGSPKNPQFYHFLGVIMTQQQRLADARKCFEKALELSPDLLPPLAALIELEIKDGKASAAMERAKALTAKAPNSAMAHFLEARTHAAQGNWDEVDRAVLKTLEIDGKIPGIYALLAESFRAREKLTGKSEIVENFMAKRPGDEFTAIVCAQFYTEAGEFEKARDLFEKFLAAKPDSAAVLNNLAGIYDQHLNQSDRALEFARKAHELEPASPVVADTLGWILYRRKEYKEAGPLLDGSAKGLPDNPEVQYHLGMVQHALGNNDAAVAALRTAANAPADFSGKEDAKRQLAQLEQGR